MPPSPPCLAGDCILIVATRLIGSRGVSDATPDAAASPLPYIAHEKGRGPRLTCGASSLMRPIRLGDPISHPFQTLTADEIRRPTEERSKGISVKK